MEPGTAQGMGMVQGMGLLVTLRPYDDGRDGSPSSRAPGEPFRGRGFMLGEG